MRIDFHVHTEYSNDGCIALKDIEKLLLERKTVGALAITDHNEIEGALRLKSIFKNNIIVGEEIDTGEGEIMGYWIKERIMHSQGIRETLECIKKQNGYVCVPHPFDQMRSKRMDIAELEKFIDMVDMIEIFNSRNLFKEANTNAERFAAKHNLIATAGSDAHYKGEIGSSYVVCNGLDSVNDPQNVCNFLKNGLIEGKRSSIKHHIKTKLLKLRNR